MALSTTRCFKEEPAEGSYPTNCTKCGLANFRSKIVWERGNPNARMMIIGEAPGQDEDRVGRPFVGRAGELLDGALESAGLTEEYVYITNVVKCRPPGNRNPKQEEMGACRSYLYNQLAQVSPQLVVLLGKIAAEFMLNRPVKITKENGKIDFIKLGDKTIMVLIIYHPAYVLRNQTQEVREGFFQAVQDARDIAYGKPKSTDADVFEGGTGRTHHLHN